MSNNPSKKLSERKKVSSALERIENLEQSLPQIISGVNQGFTNVDQTLAGMKEILDALVELTGETQVNAAIAANRARRAVEQAESMKKAVEDAVKDGRLVVAEKIGDKSLVVGKESDKDGNAVGAGRIQLHVAGIKPEFKEKLMGQGAGFSFEVPTGGKFEVTEVFDFVEPPATTGLAQVVEDPCEDCDAASCEGCSSASPDGFAEPKPEKV